MLLRRFTLHVLFPVFLGAAIYILWRSQSLLVFKWLYWIGIQSVIQTMREYAAIVKPFMPGWIIFSLPDGLWVYAVTSFMGLVWEDADWSWSKCIWLSSGYLLAVSGEGLQGVGIISGTFDKGDLISYFIAITLAVCSLRHSHTQASEGR